MPAQLPLRLQGDHKHLAARSFAQIQEQTCTQSSPSTTDKKLAPKTELVLKLILFLIPHLPLFAFLGGTALMSTSCNKKSSDHSSAAQQLLTIAEYNQQIQDAINVRNEPSTLLKTNSIAPLINNRQEHLKSLTRAEVATKVGLTGTAKTIFLNYGIIIEGASERNLLKIENFLKSTPLAHYYRLQEYALRSDGRDYAGQFYASSNGGIIFFSRYLIEKLNGNLSSSTLAHEIGHNHQLSSGAFSQSHAQRFQDLHNQSNQSTNDDFVTSYAKTNSKEDYAETYELWRNYSELFIEKLRLSSSPILKEKMLIIAKQFTFKNGGQPFIRRYRNGTYFNYFITLTNSDPNNLQESDLLSIPYQSPSTDKKPQKIVDYTLETIFPAGLTGATAYLETQLRSLASQKEILEVIYSFQGHFSSRAATLLKNLETLTRTTPIRTFDPGTIKTLDELNAYFFLDPQGVENWFLTDLPGSIQKLKDLSRWHDSNKPIHIFLTLSFLYDQYLNATTQDTLVRDIILTEYKAHLNSLVTSSFLTAEVESKLVDKWLKQWDPNYSTVTITVPIKVSTTSVPLTRQEVYQEYENHINLIKKELQTSHFPKQSKNTPPPFSIYQTLPNGKALMWLPPRNHFEISI